MSESQQPLDRLSRRYVVVTEGEYNGIKGHIALPGSVRMACDQDTVPVTIGYDHMRIIGAANDFQRSGVQDGICKVTFNIRFSEAGGFTHEDVKPLVPGLFINNVFAFQQPGEHLKWITDGIIREVSFYDPRPPAIKLMED